MTQRLPHITMRQTRLNRIMTMSEAIQVIQVSNLSTIRTLLLYYFIRRTTVARNPRPNNRIVHNQSRLPHNPNPQQILIDRIMKRRHPNNYLFLLNYEGHQVIRHLCINTRRMTTHRQIKSH